MEDFNGDKENTLLEPFEYTGSLFKAYDSTYDLNFEVIISSNVDSIKIVKFPLVAFVYTDEGYKEIYQGINVTPVLKVDKSLEFHLKFQIF
jgi:hypothetical protein